MKIIIVSLILVISLFSCTKQKVDSNNNNPQKIEFKVNLIKEGFLTRWYEADNIDSPTFWSDGSNKWIIATAKETEKLFIYDAITGETIKTVGSSGNLKGQLKRPNGVMVFNNYCFVVERDNHRVQVFSLPDFNPILTFADSILRKPYGLTGFITNNILKLYITDNYETTDGKMPPASELGERVKVFEIDLKPNIPIVKFIKSFGETKGKGILRIVESIYADVENNLLLIAEEDETQNIIKLYDLDGRFLNKDFGAGYFKGQIEGIALYDYGNSEGFWIITDQSKKENVFQIFDRKTFSHKATFKGQFTLNTDGVALTQSAYKDFPKGAFFACNDDGGISAFSLEKILGLLK
jgi:3-phytase